MGRPHQRRHSPPHWLNATMSRYADGSLTGTVVLPFYIPALRQFALWKTHRHRCSLWTSTEYPYRIPIITP